MIIIGIIGTGKHTATDEISTLVAEYNQMAAEAEQEKIRELREQYEAQQQYLDNLENFETDPTRQRFAACLRNLPQLKPKWNQPNINNIRQYRRAISERY